MLDRKTLPEVERLELERIVDLPNANRFPTDKDIAFLKARVDYLTLTEIIALGLSKPKVEATEEPAETEGDQTPGVFHKDELSSLTITKLRAIAKEGDISLTGVKTKTGIIGRIVKAQE